jgi:DeoR/GlpR family transcriptional regulator of sugar metabolism
LQSKRVLTPAEVSKKYGVSVRTIYRDIKALEQAGVPILTQEAQKLVLLNKDISLIKNYDEGIVKIKSVLRNGARDKASLQNG